MTRKQKKQRQLPRGKSSLPASHPPSDGDDKVADFIVPSVSMALTAMGPLETTRRTAGFELVTFKSRGLKFGPHVNRSSTFMLLLRASTRWNLQVSVRYFAL